jgi:hypothetical protein
MVRCGALMTLPQKKFRIATAQIQILIPDMGICFASDRVTVDGCKIGYMFRERPNERLFSGWKFMAGDESPEYADNLDHWSIFEVNTVCNYDRAIIPYLDATCGTAFARVAGTDEFRQGRYSPFPAS